MNVRRVPYDPPATVPHGAAVRRLNRVRGVRNGNPKSMSHGIFSVAQTSEDIATEVALTYTVFPALDPLQDLRLVENYAIALVQHRRTLQAIERDGMTAPLTSYAKSLSTLAERLERTLQERHRSRVTDFRSRPLIDLRQYEMTEQEDTE